LKKSAKASASKIQNSTPRLMTTPSEESSAKRETEFKDKISLNSDFEFNICCDKTRNFIQGAIDQGISTREFNILKESLDQHPLDRFARNKYEDLHNETIDFESLVNEIFEIASFFDSSDLSKYFLKEIYNLVQEENNHPDWALTLERFNKKWKKKSNEVQNSEKDGAEEKIKILFLSATPSDESRLKIGTEVREIENGIQLSSHRDKIELKSKWAVTTSTLQQAMLDEEPSIVHFSGHGDSTGIVLEDYLGNSKLIDNEAIESIFELFSDSIKCVILNSCYSNSQAEIISKHIPYVIGMKNSISDSAAIAFSVGFYKALGAGKNIEFAFSFGIASIQLEGVPDGDVPELISS